MNENENENDLGRRFIAWVLRHRRLTIGATFLVIFGMAAGMGQLTMSSDYRYFFSKDNPQRAAFEKIQNVFSKEDSVLIAIETKSGDVFNKKTLEGIRELTNKAWKVPFSSRVDSISNYCYVFSCFS